MHGEALRNFMYYKTGSLSRAEDIAHEAFIKLWENCTKVLFTKVKSYVFTIANNMFLNEIRHNKVVLEFENTGVKPENFLKPDDQLIQKEFKSNLEQAISSLPDGQREAFLMNRIDKLTYKEIAVFENVSEKAIEKRISKALIFLKSKVDELNTHKI